MPLEWYFSTLEPKREIVDYLISNRITIMTYISEGWSSEVDKKELWQINGDNLKSIHFFNRIDAWSAFQEISMWVGGILPHPGNPIVEIIDDRIKSHKHGFDKFSFRKQKEYLS